MTILRRSADALSRINVQPIDPRLLPDKDYPYRHIAISRTPGRRKSDGIGYMLRTHLILTAIEAAFVALVYSLWTVIL